MAQAIEAANVAFPHSYVSSGSMTYYHVWLSCSRYPCYSEYGDNVGNLLPCEERERVLLR